MIFDVINEELLDSRKTKFNKEADELEKETAERTIKVLSVLKAAIQKEVIDKKIDRALPSDEICISHIKKHLNQAKENRDLLLILILLVLNCHNSESKPTKK